MTMYPIGIEAGTPLDVWLDELRRRGTGRCNEFCNRRVNPEDREDGVDANVHWDQSTGIATVQCERFGHWAQVPYRQGDLIQAMRKAGAL